MSAGVKLAPADPGNAPTVAARVPPDVERALTRRAVELGAQRSDVIRAALASYLGAGSDRRR